jgi:hypothetical protein
MSARRRKGLYAKTFTTRIELSEIFAYRRTVNGTATVTADHDTLDGET